VQRIHRKCGHHQADSIAVFDLCDADDLAQLHRVSAHRDPDGSDRDFLRMDIGLTALLAIPGMFLVVLNQIWLSIVVGILATRFVTSLNRGDDDPDLDVCHADHVAVSAIPDARFIAESIRFII